MKNPPALGKWQYRIVRDDAGYCRVAEVYTLHDGSLVWTEDPIAPIGQSLQEIKDELQRMSQAPLMLESELYALSSTGKET